MSHSAFILAPLLIGSYINAMLFMAELIEAYRYHRTFPKDKIILKATMASVLVIDTICTADICALIYQLTISHWGDPSYLLVQHTPFPILVIATQLTAVIVQAFLIARYHVLSKNIIVTMILVLACLAATGGAMASAISIILYPDYAERAKAQTSVTVWISTCAAADVLVAAALIYQLRRMKSSIRSTQSLLSKLMTDAIKTGASGSIVAVTVLITFLQNRESNVPAALVIILGRVYALTMLRNLNTRTTNRERRVATGSASLGNSDTCANSSRGAHHISVELQPKKTELGLDDQSTKFSEIP
ncbi:hypothetical protein C8J56DRAFT_280397 [Mycena floridula]|nr:hypothetical protein C8J56DRAFT_280397 [Mycena floridula]